jgi:hypothetical protein
MAVLDGEATYLIGGPRAHQDLARPVYETLADENHRRYVISGEHRGWFPTTLGAKDVGLAEALRDPTVCACRSPTRSSAGTRRPYRTGGPTRTSRRWWNC